MADEDLFKEEMAFFNEHRQEFVKEARGKVALLKGRQCHGFFDTDVEAYHEGKRLFGDERFMIHDVLEEERIYYEIPLICSSGDFDADI